MLRYIAQRLLAIIPIVLGISFLIFAIMSLTPGDPARMILGENVPQYEVDALREEMGLNDNVLVQYGRYMFNAIRGDLGQSYLSGLPVMEEILERFPTTVKVALGAVILSVGIGIPLGVLSAVKRYSIIDNVTMFFTMVMTSMPNFWFGLVLLLVFSLKLGWVPAAGATSWQHYILPCLTLSCNSMALILRLTRSTMLEEVRQDYVRTARSKGAKESTVIFKHALRNSLLPVITVAGLQFSLQLGGSMIVENVFAIPGLGTLIINSVKMKDTPTVVAGIMFIAIVGCIVNLLVDLVYTVVDPRVKAQLAKQRG